MTGSSKKRQELHIMIKNESFTIMKKKDKNARCNWSSCIFVCRTVQFFAVIIHWQDLFSVTPLSFSFWKHLETVITVRVQFPKTVMIQRWTPAVLQVTRHPSIQLVIPKVLSFSWSSFIRLLRSIFLLQTMLTWAGVRGTAPSGSPGTKRSKTPS